MNERRSGVARDGKAAAEVVEHSGHPSDEALYLPADRLIVDVRRVLAEDDLQDQIELHVHFTRRRVGGKPPAEFCAVFHRSEENEGVGDRVNVSHDERGGGVRALGEQVEGLVLIPDVEVVQDLQDRDVRWVCPVERLQLLDDALCRDANAAGLVEAATAGGVAGLALALGPKGRVTEDWELGAGKLAARFGDGEIGDGVIKGGSKIVKDLTDSHGPLGRQFRSNEACDDHAIVFDVVPDGIVMHCGYLLHLDVESVRLLLGPRDLVSGTGEQLPRGGAAHRSASLANDLSRGFGPLFVSALGPGTHGTATP